MPRPAASAIIISPDGYGTVRRLVSCLRAQEGASDLELVFVFPEAALRDIPDEEVAGFHSHQLIRVPDMSSTSRARAAGVCAAQGPVVLMTEDHSLPQPGWLRALVEAHARGCAVAGPAVANGNPSLMSWVNLAIEYNEWLHPAPAGEASHLPGHNSAYDRDLLISFGEELTSWLESESVLHWRLGAQGRRLEMVPSAVTRHYNFSLWGKSLALRFWAGRQFAGSCRQRWPAARTVLYIGGSPLIPLVRAARITRQFLRPGRPARLLPVLIPLCMLMLAVETAGAVVGYVAGPGESSRRIARIDFHREEFMSADDRRRFWE